MQQIEAALAKASQSGALLASDRSLDVGHRESCTNAGLKAFKCTNDRSRCKKPCPFLPFYIKCQKATAAPSLQMPRRLAGINLRMNSTHILDTALRQWNLPSPNLHRGEPHWFVRANISKVQVSQGCSSCSSDEVFSETRKSECIEM